jgi:branched-subunit amino acid aminotransferase/4-amino-4-deoxychorismate lyase
VSLDFSEIQNIYDDIEATYKNRTPADEGLRLIFSKDLPLSYRVENYKIEKLNPIIQLQMIKAPLENTHNRFDSAYKWEDRSYWNLLLNQKKNEVDDILVVNDHDHIVETSRFNIFLYDEKKDLVSTSALDSGCLNGVYRRFVLDHGYLDLPGIGNKIIIENKISLEDLALNRIFVGNSVRSTARRKSCDTSFC